MVTSLDKFAQNGFVSFTGLANISADSATSVMIDTTVGADLTVFEWTMASERGAL